MAQIGMITLEDDIRLLETCMDLTPNHTIYLAGMMIIDSNSWIGYLRRKMYQEDRNVLLDTISKSLNRIIVDYYICSYPIPKNLISDALKGLESLIVTYKDDIKYCEKVRTELNTLNKMFEHAIDQLTASHLINEVNEVNELVIKEEKTKEIDIPRPPYDNIFDDILRRDRVSEMKRVSTWENIMRKHSPLATFLTGSSIIKSLDSLSSVNLD